MARLQARRYEVKKQTDMSCCRLIDLSLSHYDICDIKVADEKLPSYIPHSTSSQCLIHCLRNVLRQEQGYMELDNMSNGSGGSSKSIGGRCGW